MEYERKVRDFYDNAKHCYQTFMGNRWHHGAPDAEARGLSFLEACQALEEKLVALSGLKRGERALDFGCGIGGPTLHMAKISSAAFIGVSNNDRCNQEARESAARLGLAEQVSFVTLGDTDYKHLPFPDNTFDAAFFYESVCHLPDKAALFREIFRTLKPGRRLAGTDWLQRPFGAHQTEEQIMRFMGPVNEHICIPWHGTVEGYKRMMEEAGLEVLLAEDLFQGVECWGSTPAEQRSEWLEYQGPEQEMFRKGKQALDEARAAGVFTVGMFLAAKPQ